jgi:hypothetical protein
MKEYLRVYVMDGIEYYKKDGVLYPLAQVPHPVRMQHQELKELATLVAEAQDQCRNIVDVAVGMVVAHLLLDQGRTEEAKKVLYCLADEWEIAMGRCTPAPTTPPECLPESQPRYAGEVQEIKEKGVVVKARRGGY